MRILWSKEVQHRHHEDFPDRVLYLTLCGEHALDIHQLVEDGVVKLLESGAVDLVNSPKVVAFEKNSPAAFAVKRAFPGLDVRELDIHDALRLAKPLVIPDGPDKKAFEAAVVNLDYDGAMRIKDGQIQPIRAVSKIASLQALKKKDWSLLLTLNASVNWSLDDQLIERNFLAGASADVPEVVDCLRAKSEVVDCFDEDCDLASLDDLELLQTFQSMLITARVAEAVCSHGWVPTPLGAYIYGGHDSRAPMLSFIFRMNYSNDAHRKVPSTVSECLREMLKVLQSLVTLDQAQQP